MGAANLGWLRELLAALLPRLWRADAGRTPWRLSLLGGVLAGQEAMKNCNAVRAGDGAMLVFVAEEPFLWDKLTIPWLLMRDVHLDCRVRGNGKVLTNATWERETGAELDARCP